MELVLYYIKESRDLLISFLIFIFVTGTFAYISMRNFRQDSRFKVNFYGLFLELKSIDVIKLSIIVLRSFLVFYSPFVVDREKLLMFLIMIAILSLCYIIINFKSFIYQLVASLIQIALLYYIYLVNSYMSEVGFLYEIFTIKVCLIVFVILLTTYFLLRDFNTIIESRWNKDFEREKRKEVKNGQ